MTLEILKEKRPHLYRGKYLFNFLKFKVSLHYFSVYTTAELIAHCSCESCVCKLQVQNPPTILGGLLYLQVDAWNIWCFPKDLK